MKRYHLTTAAALVGLGLCCGCASTGGNANACGERQGLFSRWFGGAHHQGDCECVQTGRVVGEGPVVPDPGCTSPGCAESYPVTPGFPATPSFPPAPTIPTMPPPTAVTPNPLAQPIPANPSSVTKDAAK